MHTYQCHVIAGQSAASLDFMTSSPSSHIKEFNPPTTSQDSELAAGSGSIEPGTSNSVEDLFVTSNTVKRRTPLRSTGSSSSTSLEVGGGCLHTSMDYRQYCNWPEYIGVGLVHPSVHLM